METFAIIGTVILYAVILLSQHVFNYWMRSRTSWTPPIFGGLGVLVSIVCLALLTLKVIKIWWNYGCDKRFGDSRRWKKSVWKRDRNKISHGKWGSLFVHPIPPRKEYVNMLQMLTDAESFSSKGEFEIEKGTLKVLIDYIREHIEK